MRNTKQGSSGNLVWTSISDGVIRRKDRSQRGLPGHYRGRHMPVSAKLAEKVGIAISRAERAYLVAESKPNVGLPLHRLSSTCFDCPRSIQTQFSGARGRSRRRLFSRRKRENAVRRGRPFPGETSPRWRAEHSCKYCTQVAATFRWGDRPGGTRSCPAAISRPIRDISERPNDVR
jgi:hypothetical protein